MQFLLIQTAFTGDVILATALAEKLHLSYPEAKIDFLLRKGNEGLLAGHPFIREVLVWDKRHDKLVNLLKIAARVRSRKYDAVINVHRFASSGFITALSGAGQKIGFDKNPFSAFYTMKVKHCLAFPSGGGGHEINRNQELIKHLTDSHPAMPRLYPSEEDFRRVSQYKTGPYVCIAPASVWFTKQFPAIKWIEFIKRLDEHVKIYFIGSPADRILCEEILCGVGEKREFRSAENLAGSLSLLASAALMRDAKMNYVNDSAPLHIASAMDAPVTAVFCSTVPAFGFGPLSRQSFTVETKEKISCRPCGLHGFKTCPEKHFRCAASIEPGQILIPL